MIAQSWEKTIRRMDETCVAVSTSSPYLILEADITDKNFVRRTCIALNFLSDGA